jgi:hypothetical protein
MELKDSEKEYIALCVCESYMAKIASVLLQREIDSNTEYPLSKHTTTWGMHHTCFDVLRDCYTSMLSILDRREKLTNDVIAAHSLRVFDK